MKRVRGNKNKTCRVRNVSRIRYEPSRSRLTFDARTWHERIIARGGLKDPLPSVSDGRGPVSQAGDGIRMQVFEIYARASEYRFQYYRNLCGVHGFCRTRTCPDGPGLTTCIRQHTCTHIYWCIPQIDALANMTGVDWFVRACKLRRIMLQLYTLSHMYIIYIRIHIYVHIYTRDITNIRAI